MRSSLMPRVARDRVDLSGYYVTDLDRSPIQSVFAFIGTAAFTGPNPAVDNEGDIINYNGQVNYNYDGATIVVSGDANGDNMCDANGHFGGNYGVTIIATGQLRLVPEPGTLALLGITFLGVAAARRRRS